jgi:hypothetical protein
MILVLLAFESSTNCLIHILFVLKLLSGVKGGNLKKSKLIEQLEEAGLNKYSEICKKRNYLFKC